MLNYNLNIYQKKIYLDKLINIRSEIKYIFLIIEFISNLLT